MSERRCDKCEWFDEGYCIRFPPQVGENDNSMFPMTSMNCRCGEFREKDKEDENILPNCNPD